MFGCCNKTEKGEKSRAKENDESLYVFLSSLVPWNGLGRRLRVCENIRLSHRLKPEVVGWRGFGFVVIKALLPRGGFGGWLVSTPPPPPPELTALRQSESSKGTCQVEMFVDGRE